MIVRPVVTVLLLFAPSLFAETLICGTGAAAVAREARLAEAQALRGRGAVAANAVPNVEMRNGLVLVDVTEASALFLRPFDLGGRSLRFVPAGGDAFSVTNIPLVTPESRGTQLALTGSPAHARYTLASFSFPFGARSLREVTIGSDFSIRSEPPPAPALLQYDALEAATHRAPLIAPLLNPKFAGRVNVFVHDTAEGVTVTWSDAVPGTNAGSYDVRATLHRNGTITFSYLPGADPENEPTLFGAPTVVSASVYERTDLSPIASGTDGAGEPDAAIRAVLRPAVDFRGATLRRLGDTDLLRLDVELAGPLPSGAPALGTFVTYVVTVDGARRATIAVPTYTAPSLGVPLRPVGRELRGSNALSIDGSRITVWLTDELLGLKKAESVVQIHALAYDQKEWNADEMSFRVASAAPQQRLERDFSASVPFTRPSPLTEAFTLPALDPEQVWRDVKSAMRWNDDDWDGVMLFQNFDTDIGLEGITAYATYGFSSDNGIGMGYDDLPTLMHVNRVRRKPPSFPVVQNDVLLHEFGHRWLFSLDVDAAGRDVLSPDGAHPPQWLDTRAAFAVHHADSCSSMGGAFFHETGSGKYKAGTRRSYGYSWLDLYGMGLAAASEVPPSFYLDATDPALRHAYWAPAGIEVSGTRKSVTVQDVIARLGSRSPAWPHTKRKFRVAFVLVRAPGREVTAGELAAMRWERDAFVREFSLQTGGRGSIDTPLPPSKRRAARH